MFFFLLDSPMHAEVNNTPNPGLSLNPCQIFHLQVDGISERKSLDYVRKFMMINPDGSAVCLTFQYYSQFLLTIYLFTPSFLFQVTVNERSWKETRERTYELYACETKQSHAELVWRAKCYGITDSWNNRFLLESKKNQEMRDKIEAMEDDEMEKWRLFNPFLELEGIFFLSSFFDKNSLRF